jgi:hypothetical protein
MKRLIAAGLVALTMVAVAACDGPAGPGGGTEAEPGRVTGFANSQTADLSGYYLPTTPVTHGAYRLDHIFIGQAADFTAWQGGARDDAFAPVMLEFSDLRSPVEPEGSGHMIRMRVLPRAYAVSDVSVRFTGTSPGIGEVRFEGALDAGALAEARRNLGGREAPALTGSIVIGGRTFDNVAFTWWMGD